MLVPDFLRTDEYGEIFLAGHRVTLYHLLTRHRSGENADALAASFPTVEIDLIRKAIAFYNENRQDVERYLTEAQAEIDRQRAAPQRGPNFAEMERRMAVKRSESA